MFCTAPSENQDWAATNADLIPLLQGQSAAVLVSVLGASPDCIKLIEPDGALSFMNENGQKLMEVDDFAGLFGAQWSSLWPVDTQGMVDRAVKGALAGEAQRFEARCPTAKGSERWWDVSVAPITNAEGDGIRLISISREITHRIRREEALREREAELERLAWRRAKHLKQLESQIFDAEPLKA